MNPKGNHESLPSPPMTGHELSFAGFEPLHSNYVYCPNQFLDVCLPNCSRGAVRIVAFVLRQTLGWLDSEGQPLQQDIAVSYRDFIDRAGVSRGGVKKAVTEAFDRGFIEQVEEARPKGKGRTSQTAAFRLRWSNADYTSDVESFNGFYAGEGYRKPVPNHYFDNIIPTETLAVSKVVGAVIRRTVGYANQFGGRRSTAPLSYRHILKYSNLSDRTTLSEALKTAIGTGYIRIVHQGSFDVNSQDRTPTSYAIRWLGEADRETKSSKTRLKKRHGKKKQQNGRRLKAKGRLTRRHSFYWQTESIRKRQFKSANNSTPKRFSIRWTGSMSEIRKRIAQACC